MAAINSRIYGCKKIEPTWYSYGSWSPAKPKYTETYIPAQVIVQEGSKTTIVVWEDGSKTIVKCIEEDTFTPQSGLLMATIKKIYGNTNNFYRFFNDAVSFQPSKNELKNKGNVMKIIIAGSRDFTDYEELKRVCDVRIGALIKEYHPSTIEIVSGTARGADQLGERYAYARGYKLKRMPADWGTFGKSAGVKRNAEMAKYAKKDSQHSFLFAFTINDSPGTKNMIETARNEGISPFIFEYTKEV